MLLLLCVVIAYLLGSISPSTMIGRLVRRVDIRQHGSGNAGATNTVRVLGIKWGIVVLLLDVLKGVLAVWLASRLGHSQFSYTYLSGLAVIIGHNWPIFFGFKGGKGIATTIGVLFFLLPASAGIAGGIGILLLLATRYVSLAALTFAVLTPVVVAIRQPTHGFAIAFTGVITLLALYRHRANIRRLLNGSEHRIFSKGKTHAE